ncbi:MAG: triphosphoribosyl-dephospho-CoA synthase MdcB [Desulfuromonadaceae bacterium]|nr:triphosphoribosyl-dephospho-CoA synthase MdcB [Desulfuromonadaceae bacterium]
MEMLNIGALTRQETPFLIDDFQWLDILCLEALRLEAMAWPKPGLVTPLDSGSHHDMDINSFHASIASLKGYFGRVAQSSSAGLALPHLQSIGIEAERRMLLATGGANTHRGAIFNLGLLAAAAARRKVDYLLARKSCGEIVRQLWGDAISTSSRTSVNSHGNEVYKRFAVGGARSEAGNGFPAVYLIGLPVLRRQLTALGSMEIALIGTLLALMEHVEDTNLLWRGGEEGLAFVQTSAREFNSNGGVEQPLWRDRLIDMHREFVSRNLSPGGSADLLAATWAAYHIDLKEGIV